MIFERKSIISEKGPLNAKYLKVQVFNILIYSYQKCNELIVIKIFCDINIFESNDNFIYKYLLIGYLDLLSYTFYPYRSPWR